MLKISPLKEAHLKNEILGGITTFLTLSYIIVVNPSILATEGTGMDFSGILAATVLLSFLMTLAMGLFANLPFAIAPGMGLNAFFTFTVILGEKIPWQSALRMVFWSGFLFLLISLTSWREKLVQSIPKNLQIAASVGIGLFLSFIGLKNSGLITSDPVTFLKFGKLNTNSLLALGGFFTIAFFMKRNGKKTTYIESASGIESGAKTDWASIVTAFCFLPFLFISPLAAMIPSFATGPVLIYVGFLMFSSVKRLDLNKPNELIPAFLTIILIPLSFSITKGILIGFTSYVIFKILNRKKVNPIMLCLAMISILLFYLEN